MDHSELIKKIKPSIALILLLDSNNQIMGTGSGFIFHTKGILVTCNHVVKDASSIMLKFPDSDAYLPGKTVVRDDEHDLALVKFDNSDRTPLVIGDMGKVVEGMRVVFSGYPFSSRDLTTHQGIISAIVKDATGITSYLIDGTVNSGNSGCPLMGTDGKVIGVVNAKRRQHHQLLEKVEKMGVGALSLYGIDIVEIYQALAANIQLGVGAAVPAHYIPEHKEISS